MVFDPEDLDYREYAKNFTDREQVRSNDAADDRAP